MAKTLAVILAAALCVMFASGCSGETGVSNTLLPGPEGIADIQVSSMPDSYEFSVSGPEAKALAEYILSMDVQAEFPEDPNVYTGMTWVLDVTYDTGDATTVYLFGNMFIRADAGPWQKVTQEEAQGLEEMLHDLSGRS